MLFSKGTYRGNLNMQPLDLQSNTPLSFFPLNVLPSLAFIFCLSSLLPIFLSFLPISCCCIIQ